MQTLVAASAGCKTVFFGGLLDSREVDVSSQQDEMPRGDGRQGAQEVIAPDCTQLEMQQHAGAVYTQAGWHGAKFGSWSVWNGYINLFICIANHAASLLCLLALGRSGQLPRCGTRPTLPIYLLGPVIANLAAAIAGSTRHDSQGVILIMSKDAEGSAATMDRPYLGLLPELLA
jgi:hypothetical protein